MEFFGIMLDVNAIEFLIIHKKCIPYRVQFRRTIYGVPKVLVPYYLFRLHRIALKAHIVVLRNHPWCKMNGMGSRFPSINMCCIIYENMKTEQGHGKDCPIILWVFQKFIISTCMIRLWPNRGSVLCVFFWNLGTRGHLNRNFNFNDSWNLSIICERFPIQGLIDGAWLPLRLEC